MKKGRAKKLLGICIFLMGLMIFYVLPVQAAAPRMYSIQPGKTWTRYDITGDGKKDRIKVVRRKSQYDGCWNGADIYVNNTKVCAINKTFMDMSIRIITLSNGKPFLCLRGGTDNDISVFHGLYQYRNGKIVQVVNFINETYGRPVNEAKIYLSGNTIRVRTEAMSYSLGYCTTEFTYKYQKGTLLRTSNYGKYTKLNAANKRTGLFAHAICGIIICIFLTNFIWSVKISDTEEISNTYLESLLGDNGISVGVWKNNLDTDQIERNIQLKCDDIRWMSINIMGSLVTVEVKETYKKPKLDTSKNPCNVKAVKDGVITRIQAYNGRPVVTKGCGVENGQILDSGLDET